MPLVNALPQYLLEAIKLLCVMSAQSIKRTPYCLLRHFPGTSIHTPPFFCPSTEEGGYANPELVWSQPRDEVKRKFGGMLPIPGQVRLPFFLKCPGTWVLMHAG